MRTILAMTILLAALFTTVFITYPARLDAHAAGRTLQAWAPAPPTIDGTIGEGEWGHAHTVEFDLGGGYAGTLYTMNDASNLYIAAKVADDNFDTGAWPNTDAFVIMFDNNNDGIFPGPGDDFLYVRSDGFGDGYYGASIIDLDTTDAGTSDGSGAMANGGSEAVLKNSFELAHPLDSADDAHDFSLTPGQTVGFAITYNDGDGSGYTGTWPGSTGSEMGDIVVASQPPTLSAWAPAPPTIDGNIDPSEWAAADSSPFVVGWNFSGTVYVMNDAGNLYLAVRIADPSLTSSDYMIFSFDNDNDGEGPEEGDDNIQTNGDSHFRDVYFKGVNLVGEDVGDGGTAEGDGEAGASAGYNHFELTHPLDSADDAHDFSLTLGQTVGFSIEYISDTGYWGDWPSHRTASWGKIVLASPPDFTISADPDTLTLAQGGMISSTINVTSLHAFNSSVTLLHSWVGSAPIDVTVNLPATIKPPGGGSETGSLQISAGGSATLGTYTLRINGTSGELSHHVDVAVHVTATTTTATATTESTPTTLTSVTTAVTTETSAATLTATTTPATLTPLTTLTYTTPFAVPGFTPPSTAAGIVIALVLITLIHMVGKRGKNRPD